MKIRMVQQISGSRNGQEWPAPGVEFDVDDDEGAQLCRAQMAVPIAELPASQSAELPAPEVRATGAGLTTENTPTKAAKSAGKVSTPPSKG